MAARISFFAPWKELRTITLREKKAQCLWIAHQLFARGRTGGATGNISFLHEESLFISASGACFGALQEQELCELRLKDGASLSDRKPSKEWPLHRALYLANSETGAVIHTHGFYAALWSCLPDVQPMDAIPAYTPYLKMKAGSVCVVPYAPPGTPELFRLMAQACAPERQAYLLSHHGGLCAGRTLMDAFAAIEELEEGAHTAWCLRKENALTIDRLEE